MNEIVPPSVPKPPVRWAVSVMPELMLTGPDAVLVRVGVAGLAVDHSVESEQSVLTAALLESPE